MADKKTSAPSMLSQLEKESETREIVSKAMTKWGYEYLYMLSVLSNDQHQERILQEKIERVIISHIAENDEVKKLSTLLTDGLDKFPFPRDGSFSSLYPMEINKLGGMDNVHKIQQKWYDVTIEEYKKYSSLPHDSQIMIFCHFVVGDKDKSKIFKKIKEIIKDGLEKFKLILNVNKESPANSLEEKYGSYLDIFNTLKDSVDFKKSFDNISDGIVSYYYTNTREYSFRDSAHIPLYLCLCTSLLLTEDS
jgi:hypothetical protein